MCAYVWDVCVHVCVHACFREVGINHFEHASQEGLVKCLIATETFSMGLNMPGALSG